MKRFCIIAILAAFACSCEKYYDGYYDDPYYQSSAEFLTLRNFSSDDTVWFIPDSGCAGALPEELSEWQKIALYEIGAHSACTLTFDSHDNYVTPAETYGVDERMVIYVFKKSVWEAYTWSELVSGKMWSGKCVLSVADAVAGNKVVTYPIR